MEEENLCKINLFPNFISCLNLNYYYFFYFICDLFTLLVNFLIPDIICLYPFYFSSWSFFIPWLCFILTSFSCVLLPFVFFLFSCLPFVISYLISSSCLSFSCCLLSSIGFFRVLLSYFVFFNFSFLPFLPSVLSSQVFFPVSYLF